MVVCTTLVAAVRALRISLYHRVPVAGARWLRVVRQILCESGLINFRKG
jgi:hypothetical protein